MDEAGGRIVQLSKTVALEYLSMTFDVTEARIPSMEAQFAESAATAPARWTR
jgi:hypothetical protein